MDEKEFEQDTLVEEEREEEKEVTADTLTATSYLVALVFNCVTCKRLVVFANNEAVKHGRKGATIGVICPTCKGKNVCVPDERMQVPRIVQPQIQLARR